jgi:uroporphyrinogen decarboxylase
MVRAAWPQARIIGFPRAATLRGYEAYAQQTGVNAISLDTAAPMDWAAATLGNSVAVQGNLDPLALLSGGDALGRNVDAIRAAMRGVPFIFNLGHGILPETPLSHVEALVAGMRA